MPDLKKTKKQSAQESFHLSAGANSFQLRNFVGDCIFTKNVAQPDKLTYTFKSKKVYHVTLTKNGALMGEIDTDKAEEGTGEFSAGNGVFTGQKYSSIKPYNFNKLYNKLYS